MFCEDSCTDSPRGPEAMSTFKPDFAEPERNESLAQIATQWSLLRLAHELNSTADGVAGSQAARQALLLRYSRAVRRFVGFLVKDSAAADDVAQDAMVRLMRGDFAKADAERGRFRDLLRHAIRNMVRNYWSRENRRTGVEFNEEQFAADEDQQDEWLDEWKSVVLDTAWRAFEQYQIRTPGSVAYSVLRLRADNLDDDSEQLSARVSKTVGRPINAAATRQQLRRARLRFAQLLVEEVARGLTGPTPEAVEAELISLGLMEYVRDFLPDDWRTQGQLRAEEE